jgi:hypothetical protein
MSNAQADPGLPGKMQMASDAQVKWRLHYASTFLCTHYRIMQYLKIALLALLFSALPIATHAADLDKSDPVRKQLLDAAREDPEEKFVVKYMLHESSFGYLCAFKLDKNGSVYATDEDTDIYNYLLVKQGERWISRPYIGGLTAKYQDSDCAPNSPDYGRMLPEQMSANMQAMQSLWIDYMLHALRDNPDQRKWQPEDQAALAALRTQGMLKTFPVDIVGKEMNRAKLITTLEKQDHCKKNAACNSSADKALAQVGNLSTAQGVSELVWYACDNRTLRDGSIEHLAQCVASYQNKPYCRAGMDYFTDKSDVMHCFTEIAQMPYPN